MENYKKCKVENCENSALFKNNGNSDFCCKHYTQIQRHKKILERTVFDSNEIIDCGDYYEICLYNRKCEEVGRTKIDKDDLKKVKKYKWGLNGRGYVKTNINRKTVGIHQLILGETPIGYEIDHHDTDKLNNRKYNLRIATHQQNLQNRISKGYRFKDGKWEAQIRIEGKYIYLGRFDDEQDADKARKEAELKYFGEFAYKETN